MIKPHPHPWHWQEFNSECKKTQFGVQALSLKHEIEIQLNNKSAVANENCRTLMTVSAWSC